MTSGLLLILAAYAAGSIPFGYIVARLVGRIDIRQHGSGNIGATNVGRVLGARWGILVLLLDLLKGLLPVGLLSQVLLPPDDPNMLHWQVAAGLATIAGHMFPFWIAFRGGKGVATALGVVLYLAPTASLAALSVFVLTFAVSRIVALASILAALAFAVCQIVLLLPEPFSAQNWSLSAFSILVPLLIIVRHRANIGRLVRGQEPRYQLGKRRPAEATPPQERSA